MKLSDEQLALVQQALYVARDTRLTELCLAFDCTTSEAAELRARFDDLHEAIAILTGR